MVYYIDVADVQYTPMFGMSTCVCSPFGLTAHGFGTMIQCTEVKKNMPPGALERTWYYQVSFAATRIIAFCTMSTFVTIVFIK